VVIAMKLPKLPDDSSQPDPKAPRKPKSLWDTIITSTPVVMTVLATILAGLSSSEMSQSQYYMARSAKEQSKAGDQWSFFQSKKARGAAQMASLEVLRNTGEVAPLTPESFRSAAMQAQMRQGSAGSATATSTKTMDVATTLDDPEVREALVCLSGELPPLPDLKVADDQVRKAVETVRKAPDEESDVYSAVREPALRDAVHAASLNAIAADEAMKPAMAGVAKLQALIDAMAGATRAPTTAHSASSAPSGAAPKARSASDRGSPPELRLLASDFAAARLRFEAARQDREARVNQQTAYLYEVGVRKTAWESERHRARSRSFFFGMLGAQAAVTIASLALAVRERSWLWTTAATIGVLALLSAAYVYLFT
jgi:hypothetical protein